MKRIILVLLATLLAPAQAEIFKCRVAEQKTIYQSVPCPDDAVNQQIIEIKKPDPARVTEAEARLKVWQAEQDVKEAEKRKAQKERQEALDRQAAIDALNRSAIAQEELAEAAKHPVIINQPLLINPYFGRHRPDGIQLPQIDPSIDQQEPPVYGHKHPRGR